MAGLTPKSVAGRHLILFETFYLSLDPTSKGSISAADAANFLKRSQLSDTILSKIWDLSDTQGKGCLDKLGFFTSLKLVALAQNGREVTPAGLLDDVPEPEMDAKAVRKPPEPAKPPVVPPQPAKPPAMDWTPKQNEFAKYKQMYLSREPENGKVPGGKAKALLMESQLPMDKLGKIWDLADVDKDGALSEAEFTVAMHLVCKCLEMGVIPDVLPVELQKLIALGNAAAAQGIPPMSMPAHPPAMAAPVMQAAPLMPPAAKPLQKDNWVVPLEDRAKYRNLFESCDKDRDGYVSGAEIKDVFLQSGLPQNTLAHIWNLCDTDQSGKLSTEQFALAMWFVKNALVGIAPPNELTPEMLGPSMTVAIQQQQKPAQPEESNPEFALIIKEINELSSERINIEDEIASKDSEKKIKSGEIKSLQSELETLTATLKQLENQKSVAVGKLAELESQVTTLREQAEEQESSLITQELELSSKAAELQGLDQEEHDIMTSLEQYGRDIEKLGNLLQDALLQINQNKTRVTSLTDLKTGMDESITKFVGAIESSNVYTVTEPELRDLKPELDELLEGIEGAPQYLNGDAGQANGFESAFEEPSFPEPSPKPWGDGFGPGGEADPFAPKDPFAPNDPFAPSSGGPSRQDFSPGKDPFGAEPFAEEEAAPALPPKRPPPRPAPPKNAPARPPPPSMAKPSKPDPFTSQEPDSGGFSEFADFANFDNQQPWGSSSSNNNNHHHPRQQQQQHRGLGHGHSQPQLEFTEDPFKNYRYEDPFAHSDPFAR